METQPLPPSAPAPAPSSHPSSNDKLLAILCHLSGFIGVPLVLPLIIYLVMKEDARFVKEHAREALNFHLSLFFYTLLCVPLTMILIGVPLLIGLGLFSAIVSILAAVKVSDGTGYRYPLCIRLVT